MEIKGVKTDDYFVTVHYDKEKIWESKVISKKTTFDETGRLLYVNSNSHILVQNMFPIYNIEVFIVS